MLYAMLCDLLTVRTVVLSQKNNTLTYLLTWARGKKRSWKGPVDHCRRPTSYQSEKKREMIVNAVVDGYTEALNHQKILRKMQKTATYW